ncbi:hypothetical protein KSS87_015924 [Heliosperma pusillum]|nr:hypothetical protein KSS87_015924 [Heliosperma pusillum]
MEGVASIALLPCGSISGHFIHLPHSTCYGLHGTELTCERECSRGEDYRLIKLNIIDFNTNKQAAVVVECKGHDAARFHNVEHAHGAKSSNTGYNTLQDHNIVESSRTYYLLGAMGTPSWENDVVKEVEQKLAEKKILVSFECESLKADKAAEDHIRQFMPKLTGMDAVVNIGKMVIKGLDFEEEDEETEDEGQR